MYFRNSEDLLDKVKKLFGDPSEKNEDLKNEVRDKLADYHSKVADAQDLLKEAASKIWEANHLSEVNQKNMTMLEVSADEFYPRLLWFWLKMEALHD